MAPTGPSNSIRSAGSSPSRSIVAFLLFAIAASAVGIVFVLMRNRRPNTMEHSIEEFERGLRALAPEYRAPRARPDE